jgi:hypothetical protein
MSEMAKDVVIKYCIHIGLPKTGNKFLRRRFFPVLKNIYYCEVETAFKEFMTYFRQTGDLEFDVPHARRILDGNADASKNSLVHVLSDDVFSAFPWNGAVLRRRNCDRIAAVFEDPHIVIVLRNQFDMLQSHYLQYIREGATDTWKTFLCPEKHSLVWARDYLKYGNYVKYLIDIFGRDRVTVLFYEDFKRDSIAYLYQWCDILEVQRDCWDKSILDYRENTSLSAGLVPVMRFINKFTSSSKHPNLLLPKNFHGGAKKVMIRLSAKLPRSGRTAIPRKVAEEFLKDCHESNRLLEEIVGRDLGSLGYPGA